MWSGMTSIYAGNVGGKMTKREYDERQNTLEKKLVTAWGVVQAEVKNNQDDSDYSLNIYAMFQYEKFGEEIRKRIREVYANSEERKNDLLIDLVNAVDECNNVIYRIDKLNYQKLQQTLKYINDIRHKRVRVE